VTILPRCPVWRRRAGRVLSRVVTVVVAVCAGVTGFVVAAGTDTRAGTASVAGTAIGPRAAHVRSCVLTPAGVDPCGLWWGAALDATDSHLPAAVTAVQAGTGRRLDLVHTYHRWYDTFPTANELQLARSGHGLLLNWEPVDRHGRPMSWAAIAAGTHDAQITATARRLSATGTLVFLTFSHEPESALHAHGTPADFAAAFRHVHDVMAAAGAHNIRWVFDVMGLATPLWHARYLQMWPGARYVDWVAWDPYNWGTCRHHSSWQSFAQTVTPFYDWLHTAGFGGKPFMLAEYGTVERPGHPTAKADWLTTIPTQLARLPNLRALVYFDVPHPPANCNWQIATSHAAEHAFGVTASSGPFRATRSARLAP